MTAKTKAELETEFATRRQALEEELNAQRELIEQYRQELAASRDSDDDGPDIEREAELLYDPYDSKNPFKVIGNIEPNDEYPDGAVVAWKSPAYRARRQWRGWKPFAYGDQYTGKHGDKLSSYIPDPPPMLQGTAELDNYVRRGDVVLARLDKRIWESRQAKRILDSERRRGQSGSRARTVIRDGVELVGEGISQSHRPRGGFRPESENAPQVPGAARSVHPTTRQKD
jgi:hypothetical protein